MADKPRVNLATTNKIEFYLDYTFRKLFCLWYEVKKPKLKFFIFEMIYSFMKIIDRKCMFISPFNIDYVQTKFGNFIVRPKTTDLVVVSPAYERKDLDKLIEIIDYHLKQNKKVLFIDVGSNIGSYSIAIGNAYKNIDTLHIMSIEAAKENFDLLKKNVYLNKLENKITLINAALADLPDKTINFSFNKKVPGCSGVSSCNDEDYVIEQLKTTTLDLIIQNHHNFDVCIIKIDVEGYEIEILKGAEKLLNSKKEIYLLVEDFIKLESIEFIKKRGFVHLAKLTPYNSWWKKI